MAEENGVITTVPPTVEATNVPEVPAVETSEVPEVPVVEKEQTIPKSRFDEVNDERNNLREQNRLLIQMQQRQNQPVAPEPEMEYLDPAVKKLADENKQLKAAFGGVINEIDAIKVKTNPNIKDYAKYEPQVEQMRSQLYAQGQFTTREQVYFYIKGQEALKGGNRKPEPVVAKEPETPVAMPQTKATVKISQSPKGPETLEQKVARLKNVTF